MRQFGVCDDVVCVNAQECKWDSPVSAPWAKCLSVNQQAKEPEPDTGAQQNLAESLFQLSEKLQDLLSALERSRDIAEPLPEREIPRPQRPQKGGGIRL